MSPSRTRHAHRRPRTRATSSARDAALGADDDQHVTVVRERQRRQALRRVLVQHVGRRGAARCAPPGSWWWPARATHRHAGAPGLLGGGEHGRLPLAAGLVAALAAPLHDAARRLPRHDLVDPELGRRLDRLVVAVALGQRLHEHEPGLGSGSRQPRRRCRSSSRLAGRHDLAGEPQPGAVGEQHLLPRRDPSHGGGVPPLGPVEHHAAARRGARQRRPASTRNSGRVTSVGLATWP